MTKKIKMNYLVGFIVLVLILLLFLSTINLISIIKLKKQTDAILSNNLVSYNPEKKEQNNLIQVLERDKGGDSPSELLDYYDGSRKIYSNLASEPFFNEVFIDLEKTNLYLDDKTTALTFAPDYDFVYEKNCDQDFCGISLDKDRVCLGDECLIKQDGKIYHEGKEIVIPQELKNKKISNIFLSLLQTKWAISFVFDDAGQDSVFVYTYDGKETTPIINNETVVKIRTSLGKTGGLVSVGGDDNHFLVFYSGYEGIAYLYSNGNWQNISQYFGLRVLGGGFEPKIIKSGVGNLSTWYICSNDSKPKLVKLWQNETENIQGGIDLSFVLGNEMAYCDLRSNRELDIIKRESSYIFKDNGFDNNKKYYYQSVNLNKFTGKKIILACINSFSINSRQDLYSLFFSVDGENWQKTAGEVLNLKGVNDKLFARAEFRSAESDYSPWFDGLNVISYQAID